MSEQRAPRVDKSIHRQTHTHSSEKGNQVIGQHIVYSINTHLNICIGYLHLYLELKYICHHKITFDTLVHLKSYTLIMDNFVFYQINILHNICNFTQI